MLRLSKLCINARKGSPLPKINRLGAFRQCPLVRCASSVHMLPLTTSSTEAASKFDEALFQYVGMRGDPAAELSAAAARDPDFLLAHATLGMLFVLSTGATTSNRVRPAIHSRGFLATAAAALQL